MRGSTAGPSGGLDADWCCCVANGGIEELLKAFMCCGETAAKEFTRGLCIQLQPLPDERATLFIVEGELDHGTFDVLDTAVRTALDNGCLRLVLDLSRISEISPNGVDGILQSQAEIRARGGDLVLLKPTPVVKDVLKTLEALGLTKHIKTVTSVEEAMDSCAGEPLNTASFRPT